MKYLNLADLRARAGLTQQEVAARLLVDQTAVSNWERGYNPPLKKYRPKLCEIYGVDFTDLWDAIENSMKEKERRNPDA